MIPPIKTPKKKTRRDQLLNCFDSLPDVAQEQLTAFAEFLLQREGPRPAAPPAEPVEIPRPSQETVIGAVRRLSETYHMLDKGPMLHETSALVSAHILQGRPAPQVIDELEVLFETRYRGQLGGSKD